MATFLSFNASDSGTTVTLTWTYNEPGHYFKIFRGTNPDGSEQIPIEGPVIISPDGGGIYTYVDSEFKVDGTYYYNIHGYSDPETFAADSGLQQVNIAAAPPPPPPVAPAQVTDATSMDVTSNTFRVMWTNPADPSILSYTIIVASDQALTLVEQNVTGIPSFSSFYDVTGLNPSTTYYVGIISVGSEASSDPVVVGPVTTSSSGGEGGGEPIPPAISTYSATVVSSSQIDVTWSYSSGYSPTDAAVYYFTDNSLTLESLGTATNVSPAAPSNPGEYAAITRTTQTFASLEGLSPSTTYYIIIDSVDSADPTTLNAHTPKFSATTSGSTGGGGSGDPYMTTVSGTSYKLPTLNGAIRMYQGEVAGKTLTVNATLRTMSSTELQTQNLRSAIELSKTMSAKKMATFMKGICEKEETLCFFENFYIQHGEKVLAMNVWDQKFKVLHYTGGFETAALKNGDAALAASGIYTKYSGSTIKVSVAKGAEVFISCYNSPLVRNGIFVNVPNMSEGNGTTVNVLSAADMTLGSLDSLVAVPRRDAKALRVKRELFADHDGTRIRNVVMTL